MVLDSRRQQEGNRSVQSKPLILGANLSAQGGTRTQFEAIKTSVRSCGYPTSPLSYRSFHPAPSEPVPPLPSQNRAGGQHWGNMKTPLPADLARPVPFTPLTVGSAKTDITDPSVLPPATTPCRVRLFTHQAFADFSPISRP